VSTGAGWAVGLLVAEAWDLYAQGRYGEARDAAERAVAAAATLGDLGAEVAALDVEAAARRDARHARPRRPIPFRTR